MNSLFITATGTGIGKTAVTAALAQQLLAKGRAVRVLKPVVSGYAEGDAESDSAVLLRALGQEATPERIAALSPWCFAAPLSPHLAARREGVHLALAEVADFCRREGGNSSLTLIEGAGGLMSPLTSDALNIDLARVLSLPLVLVSGTYLGALSHLLAALEAARARNAHVHAVVLSESELPGMTLAEMLEAVQAFAGFPISLYAVPRVAGADPWRQFPELTALCPS